MTETTIEPRRIDHRQALIDYLNLGRTRSLSKLHKHHTETTPNPRGIDTLKYWSRKHGWREAATEYDVRVAAKVVARVENAAVKQDFNLIMEIDKLIAQGVEVIRSQLVTPEIVGIFRTPQDFAAATNGLATLIKNRELLAGRATSRTDYTHRAEPPAWLQEQLQNPGHNDEGETDPASVQ